MGEGGADGGGGALELRGGGSGARRRRVHTHRLLQTKLATSREALILRNNREELDKNI